MEKFLVEMKTIEENDILEMTNIKESVKNLTESFQKEQLKSKILEQEFLTNALKSDFNVQQNEELDMKLYYYEKESQFLEAQAIKLSTDLETLKNEIKNKEEIQLNLTNQITNYQEIITQIENNNKIIKENFEMDISPLNIKKMGYKINKRPRSEQKSSFLDFLTVKKRLQAKQFKLKNKEFDLRKSNKEELLEIQRKTISLKLMGDSKKTCLMYNIII